MRDQYVSRIAVAPTVISGLQVRGSIVTGRREGCGYTTRRMRVKYV